MTTEPTAPQPVRELLLDVALKRLHSGGIDALQARAVTGDVGVSTAALYTHFGSMGGLISAVNERAFIDFRIAVMVPGTTDDPLSDILAMGLAYRNFAITHPNEYELLFSRQVMRYARGVRAEVESSMNADAPAGIAAFAMVVERARAILKADLIDPMDASLFSAQMWAALHGYVALELGGHFGQKPDLLVMGGLFGALLKGYGATEEDIMRALLSSSERVHLVRRPPLES